MLAVVVKKRMRRGVKRVDLEQLWPKNLNAHRRTRNDSQAIKLKTNPKKWRWVRSQSGEFGVGEVGRHGRLSGLHSAAFGF